MSEIITHKELISLPSEGKVYPKDNPLSKGELEIYYMTAKHEDILTNINYIKNGTVLDKLLKELIVDPKISYNDLVIGDKNAVMIAARILGYGSEYEFKFFNDQIQDVDTYVADLTQLKNKEIDLDKLMVEPNTNQFNMVLPTTDTPITIKILTHKDELAIDQEVKGLTKLNPNLSYDVTTRLKHMITSINGDSDKQNIYKFINTNLLARDAKAIRKFYAEISPDVDLTITINKDGYVQEGVDLPISGDFFWPE
jgi:hypothetical protein